MELFQKDSFLVYVLMWELKCAVSVCCVCARACMRACVGGDSEGGVTSWKVIAVQTEAAAPRWAL